MDNIEATRRQACTRYMLGDLSPSDTEGYEEHFFRCHECAEPLRVGPIFAENARSVFREHLRRPTATSPAAQPQPGPGWLAWLNPAWLKPVTAVPLAAAVALLCVVGYQNLVTIPWLDGQLAQASAPQAAASFPLKIARGNDTFAVPRQSQSFAVYFFVTEATPSQRYAGEIETI